MNTKLTDFLPHHLCGYVCLSEYYFYYMRRDQEEREYGIKEIENAVLPCLGVDGGKDQENR